MAHSLCDNLDNFWLGPDSFLMAFRGLEHAGMTEEVRLDPREIDLVSHVNNSGKDIAERVQ
jgi:hypothetical protein